MSSRWRQIKTSAEFRLVVPLILFGLLCYATWVYCHKLCYDEIYKRFGHKSIAIGLMCPEIIFVIVIFVTWVQMLILGPGVQPKVPPFRIVADKDNNGSGTSVDEKDQLSILPPDIYQCDPQGYPIWCSMCQSLKMERTHHSATLGYCVPRFDHYCVWIGTVVGRKNYRLFIQFSMYFFFFFVIVLIPVCKYLKDIIHHNRHTSPPVNPNILVLLILCAIGFLMVTPLFLSHIYYMAVNVSSIEIIAKKRASKAAPKYFCCYNQADGYRYVIRFLPGDPQAFWNKNNAITNIKEFLGNNFFMWFIPIGSNLPLKTQKGYPETYEEIMGPCIERMSKNYKALIQHKIEKGEYVNKLRIQGDKVQRG